MKKTFNIFPIFAFRTSFRTPYNLLSLEKRYMATKFFADEGSKTMLEKFKGIFENNTDIERLDALVGYPAAEVLVKIE